MVNWRSHEIVGYVTMVILMVIPLGLIAVYLPVIYSFSDFASIMTAGAKITAFAGLVLFSIDILLSTRLPWLDHLFGGLDKVYHIHHYTGLLAFILLVLHPLFLAARLLTFSLTASLLFFLPEWDFGVDIGKLSLALMAGILVITLYLRLKYHHTKRIHQLFGIPFFIGGAHGLLAGSVIAAIPLLRYYIVALVGVTVVSWVHTTLLDNPLVVKGTYQVLTVQSLHSDISEITLTPIENPINFIPGQFILIRFDQPELGESHPFSLTAPSTHPNLSIAVKAVGDFTTAIQQVQEGARAIIEGPYGGFSYLHARSKHQVWVAGGIGITPFLSMARTLRKTHDSTYHIDLYYSCRNKDEAVFLTELGEIATEIPNLQVISIFTDNEGYLTAERIAQTSGGFQGKEVFLCGPKPMMSSLTAQFTHFGVPRHRIHSEEFKLLK